MLPPGMMSTFALLLLLLLPGPVPAANASADFRSEAMASERAILELLDYRLFAEQAVKELNARTEAGVPLRGDELESLHENVVARSRVKDELVRQIEPYLELVNRPDRVRSDAELFHYLQTMAIGYALTDNYQDFVETIQTNDALRRMANEPNSSLGKAKGLLRKTVKQFYSVKFHRPALRGARRFAELAPDIDRKSLADPDLQFFRTVIETSATFRYLRDQGDFRRITYDVGFFFKKLFGAKRIFKDLLHESLADTVSAISKGFGNAAGLFQSRNGYLYRSDLVENSIANRLRPGDVLLEKTPFRLTDRFIPGYWGHNAIWLGTEEELKELGIWDEPAIRAIQTRIHAGMSVLEALRSGVTTNALKHFLDIDSFAVLRRRELPREELKKVILRAAAQFGKAYDFGFDVETQDTLVCSELMFMTYTDIPFRLEKKLGRYTINPDSVAEAAIEAPRDYADVAPRLTPGPPPFDVIILYADGRERTGDLRAEMKRLIRPTETSLTP